MTLVNKSFKTDRGMACFRGMILLHRGPRFMFNSQLILKETLSGLIIPNPFVKFNAFFSFVAFKETGDERPCDKGLCGVFLQVR